MKRVLVPVLFLMILLFSGAAFASELGVQLIASPEIVTDPVTMDDFRLNADLTVDGYATLKGTSFAFVDAFGFYRQGNNSPFWLNNYAYDYNQSGVEADYAILKMDILNLATSSVDFLADASVTAHYGDGYEFAGWCKQYNHNNKTAIASNHGVDSEHQNTNWVIHAADQFPIDPMYQGHYAFGCTLPNSVINSTEPLWLVITIGGNEITYFIRK